MVRGLWSSIFRERRRLLFVCALAFLAGFLFYARTGVYIHGVHASLIVGTIYAAVVGFFALVVCIALPSLRFMVEAVAVSRLGLSVFVLVEPHIGYKILANPMLTAALVVFGGILISRVMHGRILKEKTAGWRDRIVPRDAFRRQPVRVRANKWQYKIVSWLDGAAPLPA